VGVQAAGLGRVGSGRVRLGDVRAVSERERGLAARGDRRGADLDAHGDRPVCGVGDWAGPTGPVCIAGGLVFDALSICRDPRLAAFS